MGKYHCEDWCSTGARHLRFVKPNKHLRRSHASLSFNYIAQGARMPKPHGVATTHNKNQITTQSMYYIRTFPFHDFREKGSLRMRAEGSTPFCDTNLQTFKDLQT